MKTQNKEDDTNDLSASLHGQMGAEINSLQTALFSTITAAFATFAIGIILGSKDFAQLSQTIFTYPWVHFIPLLAWLVAVFIVAEATFIFISCVDLGLKRYEIEHDKGVPLRLSKEQENFVPNDSANWLLSTSSSIYYPSLVASGFSHRYFLPLFILTLNLGFFVASFNYFFLTNATKVDVGHTGLLLAAHNLALDHPVGTVTLLGATFLFVNWVIVPVLTPQSWRMSYKAREADLLIVTETLSRLNGTEVAVLGFADQAVRAKAKVCVVGPAERGGRHLRARCEDSFVPLCQIPSWSASWLGQPDFRFGKTRYLWFLIHRDLSAVFINGFPGPMSMVSLLISRMRGIPVCFFYHVYLPRFCECIPVVGKMRWVKSLMRLVTAFYGKRVDMMIAPSQTVARELEATGIPMECIKVIPTGVNRLFCEEEPAERISKARAGYSSPILASVGRLSQEKDLDVLLRAHALTRVHHPTAHLVLAGTGPEERTLKALVRDLDLEDGVTFVGHLPWEDLRTLYHAADLFCLTSGGESQGLVIGEAKACGLPCIVVDEAGAGEQISHGIDGMLVRSRRERGDLAKEFAATIRQLLDDNDLRSRLARNAVVAGRSRTIEDSSSEIRQALQALPRAAALRTSHPRRVTSRMTASSWFRANVMYLGKILGGLGDEPRSGLADLHTHPCIRDERSLRDTLSVFERNKVALIAHTVHGHGNALERDFWEVKRMLQTLPGLAEVEDCGPVIQIQTRSQTTTVTSGYQDRCFVDGVDGLLHLIVIGADRGYCDASMGANLFQDRVRLAREHGGLVIA